MTKVIHFSKLFLACAIFSGVLILSGIIAVFTRGINFGLDFKPGLIEEIRVAPTVMELTYSGTASVSVDPSNTGFDIIISGVGAENRTISFPFVSGETVGALAEKLQSVEGITAVVRTDGPIPANGLFVNSAVSTKLSDVPFLVHADNGTKSASADDVRAAVKGIEGASVKEMGAARNKSFQIRLGLSGNGDSKAVQAAADTALVNAFGAENVAIVKSDFMGSQFSKSIIRDTIILVLATLILIWIYSAVRFHWDFALGAVIALVHDSLIMVSFVAWTHMEFTTTTIAAILTIVGYSINATVVILDRVRTNMTTLDAHKFTDILDEALTATLSRSIITTVVTLFAVLSLFFFTTGEIHDFALALTVGMISGCYSSIYISSGYIAFARRHWKPAVVAPQMKKNVVQFTE
jgi:preprotein translocase subunit SecF